MSAGIAEDNIFRIIEGNPEMFLIKRVDNDSRETEYKLTQAISKNIIRVNLNIYKYGSEIVGRAKEEVIYFLNDPKNSDIKRSILIELDAKNYIKNNNGNDDGGSEIQEPSFLLAEKEVRTENKDSGKENLDDESFKEIIESVKKGMNKKEKTDTKQFN
jgi:hypothetical protein